MKVIFGGTFDPVHVGHLRMATELLAALEVTSVSLMPCYQAVHKGDVSASADQRLAMLRVATCFDSHIVVDDREILRGRESFTIDSLEELRVELGDESLCIVMGTDAALKLDTWRSAERFASLTNVVIVQRPGDACLSDVSLETNTVEEQMLRLGFEAADDQCGLHNAMSGQYLMLGLSQLDISSTAIRRGVKENKSIRYLVTDAVNEFICDNALYRE